jgi:hypothetical protein
VQSRYPILSLVSRCASTCTSLPYKLNSSILPLGCFLLFLPLSLPVLILRFEKPAWLSSWNTNCRVFVRIAPPKGPSNIPTLFRFETSYSAAVAAFIELCQLSISPSLSLVCASCPLRCSRTPLHSPFSLLPWLRCPLNPISTSAASQSWSLSLPSRPTPLFHLQTSLHHCWSLPTEGPDTIASLDTCQ